MTVENGTVSPTAENGTNLPDQNGSGKKPSVIISDRDKQLIARLRKEIDAELTLVPGYSDDLSLLRWLVGWDRQVDVIVPKIKAALRTIHTLNLTTEDFSTPDRIMRYCDNVSKPACYMPGTLIGHDKQGNVVSIQCVGKLDGYGLMRSTMISDLFVMRIAESEGVMTLIREGERRTGRQLGTVVIVDLDGMSLSMLDWTAINAITAMLSHLQAIFPDVLRKLFIVRAPGFMQMIWAVISPILAKQTQEKIEFLGSDWKDKLRAVVDEEVLFEHWGGKRKADTPYGNVRMGGKVPEELYYDFSKENFTSSDLKKVNVPARSSTFVTVNVKGDNPNRKLRWWWQSEDGDLDFWVIRPDNGSASDSSEDLTSDRLVWPKFRLMTQHVPESRTIPLPDAGVYKLNFGNTHAKIWSKNVKYYVKVTE